MVESTMLIFGPEDQSVRTEHEVMADLLTLAGASVMAIGPHDVQRLTALAEQATHVVAADPDRLRAPDESPAANLSFANFGPEHIPRDDSSVDVAVMVDALHRVPAMMLEAGLTELARALRPGGHLYVSEPVFDGDLNDLTVLVRDDGRERLAAFEALRQAIQAGQYELEREVFFREPLAFGSFDDFADALLAPQPGQVPPRADVVTRARERFEQFRSGDGSYVIDARRRVDLLRKV